MNIVNRVIILVLVLASLLLVNVTPILAVDPPAQNSLQLSNIKNPIQNTFPTDTTSLGGVVSSFLRITFLILPFLLFIWLAWGIFQYLFAGGNKEALKKAQARITYSLIGFVITILAYAISGLVQGLAGVDPGKMFVR